MSKSRKFTLLLLLACVSLKGQVLNESQQAFLASVAAHYQNAAAYSIEVEVLTSDESGNSIGIVQKYLSARKGNSYFIQTPMMTKVIGTDFQLYINHVEYWMQYNSVDATAVEQLIQEQSSSSLPNFNFEGMELDYQETNDEVIVKTLEQFSGAKVSYRFDKKRRLLLAVEYDYSPALPGQAKSVAIKYQNFQFDKAVDTSLFQLDQYVEEYNGKWQCSDAYRDYQLIKTPTDEY